MKPSPIVVMILLAVAGIMCAAFAFSLVQSNAQEVLVEELSVQTFFELGQELVPPQGVIMVVEGYKLSENQIQAVSFSTYGMVLEGFMGREIAPESTHATDFGESRAAAVFFAADNLAEPAFVRREDGSYIALSTNMPNPTSVKKLIDQALPTSQAALN